MKPFTLTLSKVFAVGALATICLAAPSVMAQDADDDVPPPEVVATLVPVYHEGHAAYWWHNRWHYRYARGWAYYRTEPRFLYEHRFRGAPVYHHYYRR